jgi:ABC-type Co2+ transport system permease subunit
LRRWWRGAPQEFLIGTDNRYSNSQCQLALWFGAMATVYLAAVWLRIIYLGWDFVGGVGLTTNLVALTGLSAFTFGSAKVITAQKVDTAAQAGHVDAKPPAASPNLLTDLVQNDSGKADLGDFQMILITLAAVTIFVVSAFNFLGSLELATQVTLPDIDTTLLSAFGLGQGAYLIKKGAARLGEG